MFKPEDIAQLEAPIKAVTELPDKIQMFIKPFIGEGKEPTQGIGLVASTIHKSVTETIARNPITTETMKYMSGVTSTIALLMPLVALTNSVWQLLSGLGSLVDSAAKMTSSAGDGIAGAVGTISTALENSPVKHLAKLGQLPFEQQKDFANNRHTWTASQKKAFTNKSKLTETEVDELITGLADVDEILDKAQGLRTKGILPEDASEAGMRDPDKFKQLLNDVELPAQKGVSSTPISVPEALDRIIPQLPVVVVPRYIPGPADEEPPPCDLVNTNQFRHEGNLFNNINNPVAAIEDDLKLAQDIAQLSGQQELLGEVAESIADIFENIRTQAYDRALYHALRSILKALAVYNYQNGSDASLSSATNHSIRYWASIGTLPPLLPTAVVEKLNLNPSDILSTADQTTLASLSEKILAGVPISLTTSEQTTLNELLEQEEFSEQDLVDIQELVAKQNIANILTDDEQEDFAAIQAQLQADIALTTEEQTDISNIIELLQQRNYTGAEYRYGSLPGTLIYAALGDEGFSGDFDSLLDGLPKLIAQRLGLSPALVQEVSRIATNLLVPDQRILEIPAILESIDTTYAPNYTAVARWVQSLLYLQEISEDAVKSLSSLEYYISSTAYQLLIEVRKRNLSTLLSDLKANKLNYSQREALFELSRDWDEIKQKVTIPTEPVTAKLFLTELLAATPPTTMTQAIKDLETLQFSIGGPLGSDLGRMTGVAASLIRATRLLDKYGLVTDEKRLSEILTHGHTLSVDVEHFPNHGMLERLAKEVIA